MNMSNKSAGTKFEKEFAGILAKHWFWVHIFQDNKNGQPCDVIAAKNGDAYLFDCKDCQGNVFNMSRIEENQYNAMRLFHLTGNSRGMFAVRFQDAPVYLVDYQVLKDLQDGGTKNLDRMSIALYGRTLDGWLDELNSAKAGDDIHGNQYWL